MQSLVVEPWVRYKSNQVNGAIILKGERVQIILVEVLGDGWTGIVSPLNGVSGNFKNLGPLENAKRVIVDKAIQHVLKRDAA